MPVLVIEAKPAATEDQPIATAIPAQNPPPARLDRLLRPAIVLPTLTILALLIHGYHPYVDDAAIYVAGIEKAARPAIFPVHAEYVLPHLKHSLFSMLLGRLIRLSHIPLAYALFITYVVSLWLMLYACWRLAAVLFRSQPARWGALLLITATLTLPVAGSAIFFIDPYLTARSFSTPATLLAIAFALERKHLAAGACLLAAFALHPLMAAYAVVYVLTMVLARDKRWGWLLGLTAGVFILGALSVHAGALLGESSAYRAAATSRLYFYLDRWAWFEIFGLFPPLVAAFLYLARSHFKADSPYGIISLASLYTGSITICFALLFTRTETTFLLARLQPLRIFQLIYILFFLLLGSLLGQTLLVRRRWLGAVCFASIAAVMLTVQLRIYPSLRHIEWPWVQPANPWEQAFLWIRGNTPENAYFAIDPNYQLLPKEDTVGFRAMTERSVLPDWSKDGGVAAIDPAVSAQWWREVNATQGFDRWTDAERLQILRPYKISWIVLPASVSTSFPCPYRNSAVLVCQLPPSH